MTCLVYGVPFIKLMARPSITFVLFSLFFLISNITFCSIILIPSLLHKSIDYEIFVSGHANLG